VVSALVGAGEPGCSYEAVIERINQAL